MSKLGVILTTIGCITVVAILGLVIYFTAIPSGREAWNSYQYSLHKADDDTKYQTKKDVEDNCRAMITSYNADKLMYEQYKDSENQEQRSWADAAKVRANRTAANYNEYILKNSFVWKNNIPEDIKATLDYLS